MAEAHDTATRIDLERCPRFAACDNCHRPLGWDDANPWRLESRYGDEALVCDTCKEALETAPCGLCGERHLRVELSQCDALGARGGLICHGCELELAAEMEADELERAQVCGAREVCERGVL